MLLAGSGSSALLVSQLIWLSLDVTVVIIFSFLLLTKNIHVLYVGQNSYTVSHKKHATILSFIMLADCQIPFTVVLSLKFATKSLPYFPPCPKCVTALNTLRNARHKLMMIFNTVTLV